MSRKIAYGGILTALCVVLVYAAAIMPSGKLGIYALSSLVIAIAVVELDIKWGTVVFAAAAILIVLLTGNINALLLFGLFFGSYPLVKYFIEKQRKAAAEILLKLFTFNIAAVAGFYVYSLIFGVSPLNQQILGKAANTMLIAGAFGAQVVFIIYDYVLSRLIGYYINRIKSALHR